MWATVTTTCWIVLLLSHTHTSTHARTHSLNLLSFSCEARLLHAYIRVYKYTVPFHQQAHSWFRLSSVTCSLIIIFLFSFHYDGYARNFKQINVQISNTFQFKIFCFSIFSISRFLFPLKRKRTASKFGCCCYSV